MAPQIGQVAAAATDLVTEVTRKVIVEVIDAQPVDIPNHPIVTALNASLSSCAAHVTSLETFNSLCTQGLDGLNSSLASCSASVHDLQTVAVPTVTAVATVTETLTVTLTATFTPEPTPTPHPYSTLPSLICMMVPHYWLRIPMILTPLLCIYPFPKLVSRELNQRGLTYIFLFINLITFCVCAKALFNSCCDEKSNRFATWTLGIADVLCLLYACCFAGRAHEIRLEACQRTANLEASSTANNQEQGNAGVGPGRASPQATSGSSRPGPASLQQRQKHDDKLLLHVSPAPKVHTGPTRPKALDDTTISSSTPHTTQTKKPTHTTNASAATIIDQSTPRVVATGQQEPHGAKLSSAEPFDTKMESVQNKPTGNKQSEPNSETTSDSQSPVNAPATHRIPFMPLQNNPLSETQTSSGNTRTHSLPSPWNTDPISVPSADDTDSESFSLLDPDEEERSFLRETE